MGHEGMTPPPSRTPSHTLLNRGTWGGGSSLLAEPVYPVSLKLATFSGCEILVSPGVMEAHRGHPGPPSWCRGLRAVLSNHGLLPWEESGRPPRILSFPIPKTYIPFPQDPKALPTAFLCQWEEELSGAARAQGPGSRARRGATSPSGRESQRKMAGPAGTPATWSAWELSPWEAALGTAAKVPGLLCLALKIICFHVGDKNRVTGFKW